MSHVVPLGAELATPEDKAPPDAGEDLAAESPQPVTPLRAVPVMPSPQGRHTLQMADIAEVEALAASDAVTSFRFVRSFNYSVNLMFHRAELSYYVALYHDECLWRVLTSTELDSAEAAFRQFEEQVMRLSEIEIRRAVLEAHNERLSRMTAQSEAQAERLRSDLERNNTLSQLVTNRQHQLRREIGQIEAQRVAAQAQLNKTLRQVQQLKAASNEGIPRIPNR
ncbi:DUF2968 domain-containing protein [Paraburkholderia sediminicola]|nr:DUF2968 domain-containing protein [Paraburkholderia sediminicola]